MIVTSDFECGNGKDITQIGERRWRIVEEGDRVTYCYYFLVELKAETPGDAGEWTLEILGDPDLKDAEKGDVGTQGLMGHTPCTIWTTRWEHWRQLPHWKIEYLEDRIVCRVPVFADDPVRVTNVIPAPYTETVEFLKSCAERCPEHAEFIEVGKTAEGRTMPGVRVTQGLKTKGGRPRRTRKKPRFVCFSGQHPIEFPGVFGTRGIADFLTSPLAEAAEIRKHWDVVVLPLVNPDGTVHGRNNFNAKGQDVYAGFEGAADGKKLTVKESSDFWSFLQSPVPVMLLNIHCYCGLGSFIEHPFNGMYVLEDEAFRSAKRRARQRVIDEYVRFGTSGLTGHARPNRMSAPGVNHQLALARGTFSILFEINAATHGPTGCAREALNCFRSMIAGYEHACR